MVGSPSYTQAQYLMLELGPLQAPFTLEWSRKRNEQMSLLSYSPLLDSCKGKVRWRDWASATIFQATSGCSHNWMLLCTREICIFPVKSGITLANCQNWMLPTICDSCYISHFLSPSVKISSCYYCFYERTTNKASRTPIQVNKVGGEYQLDGMGRC